jgi:hypothetical protein
VARTRRDVLERLNRLTLYIFAAAGIVAAVAGTLTSLPWISKNISSILLFEVSALLAYVAVEFSSTAGQFKALREDRSGGSRTLDTPESLYRAAAAALREAVDSGSANKSVLVVSATGLPNARPPRVQLDAVTREYYRALAALINHTGWSVRIIYNIESADRLDWVRNYLDGLQNAVDLEARAFVRATREIIAPLIIGDADVFLAQGDRRFHAVRAGIWIHDSSANQFTRNYFDSLWDTADLVIIRRATGIDLSGFEIIASELSSLTASPTGDES